MRVQELAAALPVCFAGVGPESLPRALSLYSGKVRDVVAGPRRIALVASDRISAFDRVLSTIPFKGEVLTRISAWWFDQTSDIIENHLLGPAEASGIDALGSTGRCVLVRRCTMLPVEVVVRGYLTGSAWRDYQAGRPVSGIELPSGLRYCEKFPVPLITPSSKADSGHDQPLSAAQVVRDGLVDAGLWSEVERTAMALFRRGQTLAAERGLILVDTKYEFGILDGRLILADEIHTPDSSRYWYAQSYTERFASGTDQRELDKEGFRRWLLDRGFSGDGKAPSIDDDIRLATAQRYVEAYEAILGRDFQPVHREAEAALAACAPVFSALQDD